MIDLKELQRQLTAGVQSVGATDILMLPESMDASSVEPFLPAPLRRRGRFATDDIESWKAYVGQHKLTTRVFVDEDALSALAVLNFEHEEGDPDWQDDIAVLSIAPSKPFESVLAMIPSGTCPVDQERLIDWLDDWSPYLAAYRADGSVMPLQEARKAMADLTVESVRKSRSNIETTFSRERTTAEKISIGDRVPSIIRLRCAPYHGLRERDVRLVVRPAEFGGSVGVDLRIDMRGALMEAIGTEFAELIAAIDGLDVYRGSYCTLLPCRVE